MTNKTIPSAVRTLTSWSQKDDFEALTWGKISPADATCFPDFALLATELVFVVVLELFGAAAFELAVFVEEELIFPTA